MERQEARDRMDAWLRDADEKERHDAAVIRQILVKFEIDSPFSNMSSSGMSREELEVLGRFLTNRTNVGRFREQAADYLEWVSTLRSPNI